MAPACQLFVGRDARHFSLSLYTPGTFQAATTVLELRGSASEQVSSCEDFLRGTAWGPRSFFHRLNPHWFLQPEVVGTYPPGTGTLGWGTWYRAWTPRSQDILPEFLSTTCEGPAHSRSVPLLPVDGCGFFNSIVVRLSFNLIFDSSE